MAVECYILLTEINFQSKSRRIPSKHEKPLFAYWNSECCERLLISLNILYSRMLRGVFPSLDIILLNVNCKSIDSLVDLLFVLFFPALTHFCPPFQYLLSERLTSLGQQMFVRWAKMGWLNFLLFPQPAAAARRRPPLVAAPQWQGGGLRSAATDCAGPEIFFIQNFYHTRIFFRIHIFLCCREIFQVLI